MVSFIHLHNYSSFFCAFFTRKQRFFLNKRFFRGQILQGQRHSREKNTMQPRKSDLMIEQFGMEATEPVHAFPQKTSVRMGFSVHRASSGNTRYHTVVTGKLWQSPTEVRRRCIRLCAEILRDYLRGAGVCRDAHILVAGIGNPNIASDAVGPKTCDRIVVTRGDSLLTGLGFPEISAVRPGVPSRTGVDTAEQIALLADHTDADLILTVDAVAARTQERLQTVLQITDAGMTPGSAMSHTSGGITRETMRRPVVSVGVPMVIRADLLNDEFSAEPMFVTRAETDIIGDCYASVIAGAVNLALSGNSEICPDDV